MADPSYKGRSHAIHVHDDVTTPSVDPSGPSVDAPAYRGRSRAIRTIADAPSWVLEESVRGRIFDRAQYRGRSHAIHVRGEKRVLDPPPPIPSCRCCAQGGSPCSSTDDLTVRDATGGWGTSEIEDVGWSPSVPSSFSCESGVGGRYLGSSFGFASCSLTFPVGAIPLGTNGFLAKIEVGAGADGLVTSLYVNGNFTSRDYGVDLYRDGSTITAEAFGSHGGSYTFPASVVGLLSSYAGRAFYVRLEIGTSVSWKVWFADDAEPGAWDQTFTPASSLETDPDYGLVTVKAAFGAFTEVVWKSVEIDDFLCGWTLVGGSPYTRYIVSNKEDHHSGDPAYSSLPTGYRVNMDINMFRTPPNFYRIELLSVGLSPGWSQQTDGFEQREWFAIGGGSDIRAKIEFDPEFESDEGVHATVGLFKFTSPTQFFPNPYLTDHDVLDDIQPYKVVESGEWFDVTTPVFVSPHGLTQPYSPVFQHARFAGLSAEESFLITIEGSVDATLSGTVDTLGDCEDCASPPVEIEVERVTRHFLGDLSGWTYAVYTRVVGDSDAGPTSAGVDTFVWSTAESPPSTLILPARAGGRSVLVDAYENDDSTNFGSPRSNGEAVSSRYYNVPLPATTTRVAFHTDVFRYDGMDGGPSQEQLAFADVSGGLPIQMRAGRVVGTPGAPEGFGTTVASPTAIFSTTNPNTSWSPFDVDVPFSPGDADVAFTFVFPSDPLASVVGEESDESSTHAAVYDLKIEPQLMTDVGSLGSYKQAYVDVYWTETVTAPSVERETFSRVEGSGLGDSEFTGSPAWTGAGGLSADGSSGVVGHDGYTVVPLGGLLLGTSATCRARVTPELVVYDPDGEGGLNPELSEFLIVFAKGGAPPISTRNWWGMILDPNVGLPEVDTIRAKVALRTDFSNADSAFGPTYELDESLYLKFRIELTVDPDQTTFTGSMDLFGHVGTGIARVQAKAWRASDAEPAGWAVDFNSGVYGVPSLDDLIMFGGNVASQWRVDEILLSSCDLLDDGSADCSDCDSSCEECEGSLPYTPDYLPIFRRQIGDPTTSLDSFICTLESGAMALDWQTRGGVQVWGGELIPYCGKSEAEIEGEGTNLGNVAQAWMHYGQHLAVRSGQTWADLEQAIDEGRAVVLQGDYGALVAADRCQVSFEGNHAVVLMPFRASGTILVGDPLCSTWRARSDAHLQAYAEALGVAAFGVTSPQQILFAVSAPWSGS